MTASTIADVPDERAIIASMPFFVSHLFVIVLVSVWPGLVPWLPGLFD